MTQRPSDSPNAGRIDCFPTKTSQQFLSQPILSQREDAFSWLADTAGIGRGQSGNGSVSGSEGHATCADECPL